MAKFSKGNWVTHLEHPDKPLIVVTVGPDSGEKSAGMKPLAEGYYELHAIAPDGTTVMQLDQAAGRMRDVVLTAPEDVLRAATAEQIPECRRWPGGKETV